MATFVAGNFSISAACYDTELCLKNRKSKCTSNFRQSKKVTDKLPITLSTNYSLKHYMDE